MRRRRVTDPALLRELTDRVAASESVIGHLTQQLAQSDERAARLASELASLQAELEAARADRQAADAAHAERAEQVAAGAAEQLETLSTGIKEQLRRHIGAIDVLRRGHKNMDERIREHDAERRADVERIHRVVGDQATRVAEVTAKADRLATEQDRRFAGLEADLAEAARVAGELHDRLQQRVADLAADVDVERSRRDEQTIVLDDRATRLEAAVRIGQRRLDEAEALRAPLAATLERLGAGLESLHGASEDLRRRLGAAEADVAAAVADKDERDAKVERLGKAVADLATRATEVARRAMSTDERVDGALTRIELVEQTVSVVERLGLSVGDLADRVRAAELIVNQAEDLTMLLDRAEELERTLGELDPDRYVSRSDLENLQRIVGQLAEVDHVQ